MNIFQRFLFKDKKIFNTLYIFYLKLFYIFFKMAKNNEKELNNNLEIISEYYKKEKREKEALKSKQ